MKKNRQVVIAFLGNFNYDSRCLNLHHSFTQRGYDVKVISFDWLTPNFKEQIGDVSVLKLKKKSSFIYYLKFASQLIINLLGTNAGFYFAEDVYTLPFVVLIAKLKRGKVFYDSRELYGFLAGLRDRQIIQKLLFKIESIFIRYADTIITTGEMDSEFIQKQYKINNTLVIRNLPLFQPIDSPYNFRKVLSLSNETKILLYQGVVLHGRGLSLLLNVVKKINDIVLVVMGDGEQREFYKKSATDAGLIDRVYFMGKIPQRLLLNYTAGADIGFALIENISLSYYYALPNKMFEYIHAGLPVIVSNFPQMKKIVDDYKIGFAVNPEDDKEITGAVEELIHNKSKYDEFTSSCRKAAEVLNWDAEIKKLFTVIE
ncbi:MAG: glycosyltransferase family 4 protein [Ignavibacteriaceae bacterium]|nr:glycosyltransferase family 4 protein [Ignavibacteriaceae bacterium]